MPYPILRTGAWPLVIRRSKSETSWHHQGKLPGKEWGGIVGSVFTSAMRI